MHKTRLFFAGLIALGMAPGTFVRTELPQRDFRSPAQITPLEVEPIQTGPLMLESAWEITSPNHYVGGFSSLVTGPGDQFLSATDAGRLLVFPRPDRATGPMPLEPFLADRSLLNMKADVEALAIDPATGSLWAALERTQEIIAVGPDRDQRWSVQPAEMEDWSVNSGPESMVRLADGRFIVIAEETISSGLHEALLFPGDPIEGGRPVAFTLEARPGMRPADATPLPDGRIAILLRGLDIALPPRFPGVIVIADPTDIVAGEVLPSQSLARIEAPLPSDNYEGLAVIDEGDGSWTVWLISDDNFAYYQRSLLLKLRWDQEQVPQDRQARKKARR